MFFNFGRKNKPAAQTAALKQEGDAALHAGDAETAERCYRAALEHDAAQPALLCNLAYALHHQGKDAEARQFLEQALAHDPRQADAHFLSARIAHGAHEFERADKHFRALLEVDPANELAYFEYCHMLAEQNRVEAACGLIEQALARFPGNADFHFYLGNLRFQAGDPAAAVPAFEQGLALRSGDVAAMANLSKALHAVGRPADAAAIAREALAHAPHLHDVRLTLASALEQQGDDATALQHYRLCLPDATIVIVAGRAAAHLLLRQGRLADAQEAAADPAMRFLVAHAMQAAGDVEGAMAGYRRILEENRDHVESLINLALLCSRRGLHDDALHLLHQAERTAPEDGLVHTGLGSVYHALDEVENEIAAYTEAARLSPDLLEAHHGLALALLRQGQLDAAWQSAVRAGEINAAHADVLQLQADILQRQGKMSEAAVRYQAALDGGATHISFYIGLAQTLQAQKRHEPALSVLRQARSMAPHERSLPLLFASSLIQTGEPAQAAALLHEAIEVDAGNISAHSLLGTAFAEMARYDEARACYERVLAIDSGHIDARASHGLLCLLQGDYEHGWDGYCLLTQTTGMVPLPPFRQPLWQNDAPLAGKSLLLYADQGMGDAMQFVRYVEAIAPLGGRITLAVQKALIGVMQTLPWPVNVVAKDDALPETDFYCPLGHLPRAFGTRLDSIPAPVPYLHANPARAAYWGEQIASDTVRRVGLVWAGNPLFSGDRDRSIPFALIERLLALPACRFHSLQKEVRPDDAPLLAAAPNIVDLGPRLADFTETAAIIANLDLVVTVDTSVAHLAGAMGKPVWIMLPYSPDFRWMLGRSDSLWYPSARLFRQSAPSDWAGVVHEIGAALCALTSP